MQLDYAIEGYWLAKRRDFSAHTVSDYQLTFRRFGEFVGKTRELKAGLPAERRLAVAAEIYPRAARVTGDAARIIR